MLRVQWRRLALVALFPTVTACGSSLKAQGPVVTPAPKAAELAETAGYRVAATFCVVDREDGVEITQDAVAPAG